MTVTQDKVRGLSERLRSGASASMDFGTHLRKYQELCDEAADALDRLSTPPAEPSADVRRLVIAARVVAFENQDHASIKELDEASEAFAARVPWHDEPDDVSGAARHNTARRLKTLRDLGYGDAADFVESCSRPIAPVSESELEKLAEEIVDCLYNFKVNADASRRKSKIDLTRAILARYGVSKGVET